MKSVEFQTFIDLVTFDQSLVKIERDIAKSQEIQESLLLDIERLQADFNDVKVAQQQARKAVDDKELSMKILDVKEADLKIKLASISNQKEYKSLEKETLAINAQRMEQEQQLLTLWNKLDGFVKTYDFKHKLYEEQAAQFHAQVEQSKNEVAALQQQLAVLNEQRAEKLQNVPQEWLDIYVNMKGRVTNPVVQIVGDACDACFYSVTPKDLQALRQNKLLQCKDCYRLLYIA